jgi:hypothetical protein
MEENKQNYIITGQNTTEAMVAGMFKEGGIPAIMSTDDKDTKADCSL